MEIRKECTKMIYVVTAICIIGIIILFAHSLLQKKVIRDTTRQLQEINCDIGENRIVTISAPNKEYEKMLVEINKSLKEVRNERVVYAKREKLFKQQIENISHDLRTPLTSMIGYLKIFDTSKLSQEEQEDIKTVIRKAEKLQELITQFYDYSRLTAQDYQLQLSYVDVSKMVRAMLTDAYREIAERQLTVMTNVSEQSIHLIADEHALQRVFQNLLQNAMKYAVSFFEISVKEEEQQVKIAFVNDVNDMDIRDAEKLFDRFYTADTSRSNGSTGLGLTIVKEFVEMMGGKITAQIENSNLMVTIQLKKYHK